MQIPNYIRWIFSLCLTICFLPTGCVPPKTVILPGEPAWIHEVEKKWDTVKLPQPKVWVDYNEQLDTRSEVDFVKGFIELETVIPESAPSPEKEAIQKIEAQAEKILKAETPDKIEILINQIKNEKGEFVQKKNRKKFIKKEVLTKIIKIKKPCIAKDGVRRIKMRARIELVPEHIQVRAERYIDSVKKTAARFDQKPELMLAVIHNESLFNPMARSRCGAIGLMQLIPTHGAKEAYEHLYGEEKEISEKYLFVPKNNIELGTAYFSVLEKRYLKHVPTGLQKQYLMLCAYNLGPTKIRQLIKRYRLHRKNSQKVYSILRKKTPKETRNYLRDVTRLSGGYKKVLDGRK